MTFIPNSISAVFVVIGHIHLMTVALADLADTTAFNMVQQGTAECTMFLFIWTWNHRIIIFRLPVNAHIRHRSV